MDDPDLLDVNDTLEAAILTQESPVDIRDALGVMLDFMPIGILIHAEHGIVFANEAACDLLQTLKTELIGQHLLDFVRASDMERVAGQFRSSFRGGERTYGDAAVGRRLAGSHRIVRLITGKLPWQGQPVIQVLLEDITDQRRAETSLRQQAITDELTGAYNRRHAFYEAAIHVAASRKRGLPFSVVLIDIDQFKTINDSRGHAIGDLALRSLSNLAHEKVPLIEGTDSAMFARIGGEEFVILLPGISLVRAAGIAEKFRCAVERMALQIPTGDLKFTISAGVAALGAGDGDFARMLSRADEALYDAKTAGRNRVACARND